MPHPQEKRARIQALRAKLSRIESRPEQAPVLSLGDPGIDGRLTGGGLSLAGLHEVVGHGYPDMGAAAGFCAGLGVRLLEAPSRSLLWVAQGAGPHDLGMLYGPGLAQAGLDPARLVVVLVKGDAEALWVAEEALRTPDLAGVVAELGGTRAYDLKASRRLQLAAERFQRPALLLAGHAGGDGQAVTAAPAPPSAALTRFRVRAAPSGLNTRAPQAPGRARFGVTLDRVRGGAPHTFIVEWNHAARRFAVAARVSGGAGVARPRGNAGVIESPRELAAAG